MMNIFVTGATGFIGTYLIQEMCKWDKFDTIYALYRKEIPFTNKKIKWIKGDLEHLPLFSYKENITKVIHCAALQSSNSKPSVLYRNNVKWTELVINLCINSGIKEIVFFSSVNASLSHCGAYAKSKQKSEELICKSGLKFKIIRPALVFGKGKNGITTLMNYIRDFPIIPVFGDGTSLEQPIYVEDLAKLTVKYILDEDAEKIIYLYGKSPMKYDYMICEMAKVYNKKIKIIHLPFFLSYFTIGIFERVNIKMPISAEQIAHIYEDLSYDMTDIYKRYKIIPRDFVEYLKIIF